MARRLRLTGFARFLIVMLFLAPLAYIGASYYHGEDGIANIKRWLGFEKEPAEQVEAKQPEPGQPAATPGAAAPENTAPSTEVDRLKRENDSLRRQLQAKEREIWELKRQLKTLENKTEGS